MSLHRSMALCASLSVFVFAQDGLAQSPPQSTQETGQGPLFVTVTANRSPASIQRTGSAITTITAEEITASNPSSLADVLRTVPGLSLSQSGGPGGVTALRLRGNDARHTLVLIDGVRVNDPTGVGGDFDFSSLATRDIERIEVLRGPQSALYGSDAIGGVVNIITKRGRGKPQAYVETEAGSRGTASAKAGVSGSTENISYAFALNHIRSDGFSRFGHRIRRVENVLGPLEADGWNRSGASGRMSWRPVEGVELEIGGQFSRSTTQTDNAFGDNSIIPTEDTRGKDRQISASGFAKATIDSLEGRWKHTITAFSSYTSRVSRCDLPGAFACSYQDPSDRLNFISVDRADSIFRGQRYGAEYQGDIRLGALGTLIIGARHEKERAEFNSNAILPVFTRGYASSADRTTNSVFALHQIRLGERTDISIGGRFDRPDDTRAFVTWRATIAHRITETGTKLRASVGTGAKAPSLYQQFSEYGPTTAGDRALRPERSLGYDVGVDQDVLDGRLKLSATLFENRLRDFIDFDGTRGLLNTIDPDPANHYRIGQYVNIARATTRGFELAGSADLILGTLRARASFTWQDARAKSTFGSLNTGDKLLRRPEQQGSFALTWTPTEKWTIEPFVQYVGKQVDTARLQGTFGPSFRRTLAPYATLGLRTEYKLTDNLKLYARAENLTNARYQEIYNYGTAGPSIYGGIRASW